MDKNLSKAETDASEVCVSLQHALAKATAVEALVLLPLIAQAAQLSLAIQAFSSARQAK